jgi:hypothetical protein
MQDELVISRPDEPAIRADRLEVAQFVYLLLNYHDLDAVLAAMTSKVVLILGHFTAGRRAVLTRLREELHRRGYLTLSFDFSTSWSGGLTRIVSTLAHLSRFIIVDITEVGGAHPAVEAISPFFDHVPTRVLLQVGGADGAVGEDGELVRSFAPRAIHHYASLDDQRSSFDTAIVLPAEASREDQHP